MRAHGTGRLTRIVCRAVSFCIAVPLAFGLAAQTGRDPARGRTKAAACAECHGEGETPPQAAVPILAGQQREFLVLQMFYLREGLRDVPEMTGVFKSFSDRDLDDVATYFSAQPMPRNGAAADEALSARGLGLAGALGCGSCHLDDYRGQRHVPRIAGQREDYLASALKAYRDNKRTGTDTSMNAAMYQVTDADIAALAHYLAHR